MSKKKKSKKRGHTPSMAELRKVSPMVKITPATKTPKSKKSNLISDKHGNEYTKREVSDMSGIEKSVLGIE